MKVFLILGCSGSGKSTRMFQFIKYLESFNVAAENKPLYLRYDAKVVGRIYPLLNMAVIGTEVVSKGIHKWQGLDSFTGHFGSAEAIMRFIEETSKMYTLVVEGTAVLLSNRYCPKSLYETTTIRDIHGIVYAFDNFQQYQERIMGRSGYVITSEAMWTKNQGFLKYLERYPEEIAALGTPTDCSYTVESVRYDSPVHDLGERLLTYFNKPELIPGLKEFSDKEDFSKKFILPKPKELF